MLYHRLLLVIYAKLGMDIYATHDRIVHLQIAGKDLHYVYNILYSN